MQLWRPRIRASYLASSFEASKSNFITYFILSSTASMITSPAPLPALVADPSTCNSYDSLSSVLMGRELHSLVKSVMAWVFDYSLRLIF